MKTISKVDGFEKSDIVKVRKIIKNKPNTINKVVVSNNMTPEISEDSLIGKVLQSNNCGSFKVIQKLKVGYLIQFIDTGYITNSSKSVILKGEIKDPYFRLVCDVGYKGEFVKIPSLSKKMNEKLYFKWYDMLRRCYDVKNDSYADYGGVGVFVDERWHSYENFLRDVITLYDYEEAVSVGFKDWQIDKDYFGSNYYSKDTCIWLSRSENMLYSNSKHAFMLITPDNKREIYIDAIKCSKLYNLSYSTLRHVINGVFKQCMGYRAIKIIDDDYVYRYMKYNL